jgi:predicted regulator of Ras-like GTPase activity (Roadblock/LC7/MglB family)
VKDVLRKINKIYGVRGVILVGADGLPIASDLAEGEDESTLGAVASSVASALSGTLQRLAQGQLTRFVMNGSGGSVVLLPVASALLLTLVRKDANMGMILIELDEKATELAALFSS